jgi:hypothetical protein
VGGCPGVEGKEWWEMMRKGRSNHRHRSRMELVFPLGRNLFLSFELKLMILPSCLVNVAIEISAT